MGEEKEWYFRIGAYIKKEEGQTKDEAIDSLLMTIDPDVSVEIYDVFEQ